jgi:SAM-dependent methyltransferase
MQPDSSPLGIIRSILPSLGGMRILDIGCGSGGFVRQLVAAGADASGVDPGAEAIRRGRAADPDADLTVGGAEQLPYRDRSFDAAVMVHSLHHVPQDLMLKAISEATRILRQEGALVIIEPLAIGSFFAALRPIDDETVVRGQAQQAIAEAISSGLAASKGTQNHVRESRFPDASGFLDFVVAVDPMRQAVIDANFDAIAANVLAAAHRMESGALCFTQPIKVDILGRT